MAAGTDASELVVAGTGSLWVAPVGTSFPAEITDTPALPDWTALGYTDEDGVEFSFDRSSKDIPGWQSQEALRSIITSIPKQFSCKLMQWNADTLLLAMGGGTITEPSAGTALYEPPEPSYVDERAVIIEGVDGDNTVRFFFRRCTIAEALEFSFVREDPTMLPVTMKVLASDDENEPPFQVQTNLAEILVGATT